MKIVRFILLALLLLSIMGCHEEVTIEPTTPKATAIPIPTPLSPVSDITFGQIYRASKEMTDVQWHDYMGKTVGQRVRWQGIVTGVKECSKDWSTVLLRMTLVPPRPYAPHDEVCIRIPRGQAATINRGDVIIVTGTLSEISRYPAGIRVRLSRGHLEGK